MEGPHKEPLKERQYLVRSFRAWHCYVPVGAQARFCCGLPASEAVCVTLVLKNNPCHPKFIQLRNLHLKFSGVHTIMEKDGGILR